MAMNKVARSHWQAKGPDQSRKQRYNVAASRAQDQMWVVHSLDITRDLKHGDIRRDLLEAIALAKSAPKSCNGY